MVINCFGIKMVKVQMMMVLFMLDISYITADRLGRSSVFTEYRRVCYVTNWSRFRETQAQFLPRMIDPFLCTHIIYTFADFSTNGNIYPDREDSTEYDMYDQLNSLKNTNPKLKTILSIGGWVKGGSDFSDMAASAITRKQFVQSAISFLRLNEFDGLEISWQFPGSRGGKVEDKINFSLLLKELKEAFLNEETVKDKLILTAVVSPILDIVDNGYVVPDLAQYLDFATVMTYDLHGSYEMTTECHSPLYPRNSETSSERELNMDFVAKMWEQKGLPKEKMNIGFATFGRSFKLENSEDFGIGAASAGPGAAGEHTKQAGFLSYLEICELKNKPAVKSFYNEEQKCSYVVSGDQWTGYDDLTSFTAKTDWVIENRYGGITFWSVELDDFANECSGGEFPLISLAKERLIADEIAQQTTTPAPTTTTTEPTTTPEPTTTTAEPTTTPEPTTTTAEPTTTPEPTTTTAEPTTTPEPTTSTAEPTTPAPTTSAESTTVVESATPEPATVSTLTEDQNTEASPPESSTNDVATGTPTIISPGAKISASSSDLDALRRKIFNYRFNKRKFSCSGKDNGMYRDPFDCGKYYRCYSGWLTEYKCPNEDLYFDSRINVCNWKERVQCNTMFNFL